MRFKIIFLLWFGVFCLNTALEAATTSKQSSLQRGSALNDEAGVRMKAGDLDAAEELLLQALAYSQENEKVRNNLGVVFYEKGVRLANAGNFHDAQSYLGKALEIKPADPRYRRAYASALFTEANKRAAAGLDATALELFEKTAALDPTSIHAWIRAADYAWKTQRLDKAILFTQKARELDPNNENVKILETRMSSSKVEEHYETHSSEHFILAASPSFIAGQGTPNLMRDLEEAYNNVSYQLSFSPKSKIPVVMYPINDFRNHWRTPARVKAFYDGKLRVPYPSSAVPETVMQPIVLHELTHAFINELTTQRVPYWLNEGLAQWIEGKQMSQRAKDALMIQEVTRRMPDLDHMDSVFQAQKNPYNDTEMTLVHMKSFSIVQYLIEQYGIWTLVGWIRDYDATKPLKFYTQKYFQVDPKTLEESWRVWLERQKSRL